jgi:hypothetical protein
VICAQDLYLVCLATLLPIAKGFYRLTKDTDFLAKQMTPFFAEAASAYAKATVDRTQGRPFDCAQGEDWLTPFFFATDYTGFTVF